MKVQILLALALTTGCAASRKARRLEGRYDTGQPGVGWEQVKPGGADQAWYNSDLQATIYADSNCATRFDDRPLDALANSVVFGMSVGDPTLSEERRIDGRDALVRRHDGTLDGVAFRLGVAVLKKDDCVYDVLLVTPPAAIDDAWTGFEAVLAGFQARG